MHLLNCFVGFLLRQAFKVQRGNHIFLVYDGLQIGIGRLIGRQRNIPIGILELRAEHKIFDIQLRRSQNAEAFHRLINRENLGIQARGAGIALVQPQRNEHRGKL